jgi:fructokinase
MRIGIDLGGTKIEGVLLEPGGEVRARRRLDTPRGDYAGTIETIAGLVADLETAAPGMRLPIGIGIPGALSLVTGLVKNANSTWLIGRPLLQDLKTRLGPRVRLANDANCFALSEATDGAAAGAPVVFGVIVGTGTGAGLVVNGRLVEGRHAIAGEWGHNPLPWPAADEWPGPPCYCGRTGCIETFLSGPGLSREYERATGRAGRPPEIVERAAGGEEAAEQALRAYEQRMARALASVINILDPDVIVLGGGMSNVERLYANVPALWGRFAFSDVITTPLRPARHGDASGVRGAAWLWASGDRTW